MLIKRTFLREEAYNILLEWIIVGKLSAGDKVRDVELSEELGISRTPIREALLRLEEEGFVVTKPNRSTTIAPIDLEQLTSTYSIVWTLEALALEEASPHFTSQTIVELTNINEKIVVESPTLQQLDVVQLDNAFHDVIITLSKNDELQKILHHLKAKIRRAEFYYFQKEESVQSSYKEHRLVIKHLEQKDWEKAKEALMNNWKYSLMKMKQQNKR
ncbi:GntR family transcriptional regulator [Alkalihalobacterium bogoriense]|uniref:GntR family transcriptional regulator n=1 Tax=Alkalihalobacterium bogoriense TaxID=246272 RepID=UPI000AAC9987|nr:GntR family transcriptional regulator [Alkalihalobacterium bogoriense]